MLVLLSFEASDPDWFKDNPHGICLIEVKDLDEKEAVILKVCEVIDEYRKNDEEWNYQDVIGVASDWLESNGHLWMPETPIMIERIDIG